MDQWNLYVCMYICPYVLVMHMCIYVCVCFLFVCVKHELLGFITFNKNINFDYY